MFGCVGSSFLCEGFLQLWQAEDTLHRGVRGPLTIAASLVAEHRLQTRRLSSCGSWAQPLRGMWDPPRPGLEPASPALAGRLSTTAPPGKPFCLLLNRLFGISLLICRIQYTLDINYQSFKRVATFSPCHVTILYMVSFAVLKFLIGPIYHCFPLWLFWPCVEIISSSQSWRNILQCFLLTYILRITLNSSGVYSSVWCWT